MGGGRVGGAGVGRVVVLGGDGKGVGWEGDMVQGGGWEEGREGAEGVGGRGRRGG